MSDPFDTPNEISRKLMAQRVSDLLMAGVSREAIETTSTIQLRIMASFLDTLPLQIPKRLRPAWFDFTVVVVTAINDAEKLDAKQYLIWDEKIRLSSFEKHSVIVKNGNGESLTPSEKRIFASLQRDWRKHQAATVIPKRMEVTTIARSKLKSLSLTPSETSAFLELHEQLITCVLVRMGQYQSETIATIAGMGFELYPLETRPMIWDLVLSDLKQLAKLANEQHQVELKLLN